MLGMKKVLIWFSSGHPKAILEVPQHLRNDEIPFASFPTAIPFRATKAL